MPNVNVIARMVGSNAPAQGPLVIPSLGFTTNTEALFTVQSGGPAVLAPFPPGQIAAASAAPSFGSGYDGFPFKVRAAFKVSTGGTSTVIISLYANQVGTAITAGNKVATITSQSLATASASGFLEAQLVWDAIGQKLAGGQQGAFGTSVVTGMSALTNNAISIASLAQLNFSLTGNMGTGSITSTMTITEFVIETV